MLFSFLGTVKMNVVPQTASFTCPCCRGSIGTAAPIEFVAQMIPGPSSLRIFKVVSKNPGHIVSVETLEHELWGHAADGGPDDTRGSIHVMVCKLNKRLGNYGWVIASLGRGTAGGYRLIPKEAGQ